MKKTAKLLFILTLTVSIIAGVIGCSPKQNSTASSAASPSPSSQATSKPKNRLDEIKARGYIEVATEPGFVPFEFIDPTKSGDDKYVGSDMKLAQYIADKLGVKLHVIPLEFSAVLSSITEKKYDLAISALSYTPEREKAMNMSKGYYFSKDNKGHGIVIQKKDEASIKDAASLTGKTIVVQSGSIQELFATKQVTKAKEVKRVSSVNDGFLMVQEGKADAMISFIPTAELYIEANKNSGLEIVPNFKFTEDESTLGTRIGIPKGETELTTKVNEIIDEVVKSGDFEKWHNEATENAKKLGVK